jgi:peptidoglycan/xylan/chitin deacetylase (PgdA/CDA1 family)
MHYDPDHQIRDIARNNGLILLYHYVSSDVPGTFKGTLHNTPPAILQKHIEDLSRYFKFVSLQEFTQSSSRRGLAVVTFDDGYKNVMANALPVLESCDCPATLFLNPVTFSMKWNWRDKVRSLIFHNLENEFAEQFTFNNRDGRFYRYSKHPDNNSDSLDRALDSFLKNDLDNLCSSLYGEHPYLQRHDLVTGHELISYGNHSQNHYVLSSLSNQQQCGEIESARKILCEIPDISLSDCFSAPFGGDADINSKTCELVIESGYKAILMSRQKFQPGQPGIEKLQVLERFMPRTGNIIEELITTADFGKNALSML